MTRAARTRTAGARTAAGTAGAGTAAGTGTAGTRTVVDATVMAGTAVVAVAPFAAAYGNLDFWIAAIAGAVLGALIGLAGALWRWSALLVAAAVVVAYFVFGGAVALRDQALAGFLPTLDVLSGLALGAVQVWRQVLTLQTPLDGFAALALAPFLLGLVASVLAVSLATRVRRFGFALLPVGALLVVAIAFSTDDALLPGVVGGVFAAGALAWSVWRARAARRAAFALDEPADADPAVVAARRRSRLSAALGVTGVVLVAAIVGGGAATAAAPTPLGQARDVVRDHVVPPLQVHDYASPLTSFRRYVSDDAKQTLFTVSGLPKGATVRLATLDAYDGIVYKVSGAGGAGSGQFTRVGTRIQNAHAGTAAHVTVRVGWLSGVWMPTVGYLSTLAFTGADAQQQNTATDYNAATGTALITGGLRADDTYGFDTVIPATPTAAQLEKDTIAQVTTPKPSDVPDAVAGAVADATKNAKTPYAQLKAIAAMLQKGYFSNGSGESAKTAPSRSGHNESRESDLLSKAPMVGDDEQYAVAMALMVAQLGMPVRVVMGFTAPGGAKTAAITGADVHAWVEVPFTNAGWVAFTPTPPIDRVPPAVVPQQREKPRVQVAQPPRAPQPPQQLPPTQPTQTKGNSHDGVDLTWLWTTLQISGVSLLILLVLFGPSVVFAVLRLRRRRSRAEATGSVERMDGGWAEVVDRAVDVGSAPTRGATRREQASVLDERFPEAGVGALALRADTAVFSATEPTDEAAQAYWDDVATATRRIEQAVPWHRRLRARLFPASLFVRRSAPGGARRPLFGADGVIALPAWRNRRGAADDE
jgi:transglutaminase-like putative cysteine protease